jgi:hypothetical protein
MAPRISVICRNPGEDRIIPRMARALRDVNGWLLGAAPDPTADAIYLSAYFESQTLKERPAVPVAGYLTHREENPPGNAKARLFDQMAQRLDLRVTTCRLYADQVRQWGPTIQAAAPLERERFNLTPQPPSLRRKGERMVVGLSGYTYPNKRKGEDLVKGMLASKLGQRAEWRASGRGWPVPTRRYAWKDMPDFYRGLDVLVVPSRVEGIPMPPLEALACGVSVVIPRGVGLLDELPDVAGIHRYEKGDLESLLTALQAAMEGRASVDREGLRAATEPYSVENWCRDLALGMEDLLAGKAHIDAGVEEREPDAPVRRPSVVTSEPVERGTAAKRGIYMVAFGGPARESGRRLQESIRKHMPDVPICCCGAKPLGLEDVFVEQPDSDVGGRRAKLKAYELSPAEWQSVLYLDADTEVISPDVVRYFEWVEAGWEFVICKDPHLMDTMAAFGRRNNVAEMTDTEEVVHTLNTLQYNGGVWAFTRNERVQRFFQRWQTEWEKHAQRDQGALVRAMYADPLKVLVLGNEWNTFPKYTKGIVSAGLMHYPGDARRWRGLIPGRIDSEEAWRMAQEFEARRAGTRR